MGYPRHHLGIAHCALCIAAIAVSTANAVCVIGDANATTAIDPTNNVITLTQNGTLTVTEPGEIEILLVGGGGGGGARSGRDRWRRRRGRSHPHQHNRRGG